MTAGGERATWFLGRRLFLGGVALVHLIAFGSLGAQVLGLYGSEGIVPLAERMQLLGERLVGWERLELPTLLWLGASDAVGAGALLALLALLGLVPRLALALCWLLYLSFVCVGSPFLDFQWDVLLLEAGLVAVLYAPGGLRPFGRDQVPPADLPRWLVYLLLFKLMVLSGAVKLTSGDPAWRDGSALAFHWWTQPLPHRLSVWAAELPAWTRGASCLTMFVIELGLPWLLVVPVWRRRLRQVVAAGVWLLMLAILATGNYGFFNLLTAVLALPLLDDRAWRTLFRRAPEPPAMGLVAPRWRAALLALLATPLGIVSLAQITVGLGWLARTPAPVRVLADALEPLRSVNSYGLFRVMTRTRDEVQLEGSADGTTWRPYRFRYKPGDPARAPVFAGLHMPRLDWQLWFVALEHGSGQRSRWMLDLVERLQAGAPSVLSLLAEDPFPDAPPRWVRATVAPYRFASPEERAQGLWWQRGPAEPFLPAREGPR
ncbi:MAG TPA: lipase maturation factor family protein [Planctomycetota bacterium]